MLDVSAWPGKSGPGGVVAALATLAFLGWLALRTDPPPKPLPSNAPPTLFSAARAFAHVQALARAPRPIASRANAGARQYIVDQLRAQGLEPQVQATTVRKMSIDSLSNAQLTLGVVHNIMARLPGAAADRATRPPLLVSAHYDSGDNTLGAADGAAPVAAILETLRALRAGPALGNDVLVLLTDGDKAGSLGAQGFADEHPWARQAGLALRFDHPGNRGPLVLYDASSANGDAVGGWARAAGQVRGSSLMAEIHRAASTSPLQHLKAPLLQFAVLEGRLGPAGAYDLPRRLDLPSLQQEGEAMLALVRHFGNERLVREEPDGQVYFTLPLVGVVHYPMALVWPLTRLTCLLMFGVCCLVVQRAGVEPIDISHATFGFLFAAGLGAFTAWLLWQSLPGLQHNYWLDALAGGHDEWWYMLAFASLAAGVFVYALRGVRRKLGMAATVTGILCATTLALVGVSAQAPGAAYVLAWPLLAAQVAFAALFSRHATVLARGRRLPIMLAGAATAVLVILPAMRDLFVATTPNSMNLPLALLSILLGLSLPLLAAVGRRFVVRSLVLGGAGILGIAHSASLPEAELPQPNPLTYFKDTVSWQSFWLMRPGPPLDRWTRQVFPNTMYPYTLPYLFGLSSDKFWFAAAPRDDGIAYPDLLIQKVVYGRQRHVEFRMVSRNRAPKVTLLVEGGGTLRTSVNGRVLAGVPTRGWNLTLYGMEDQPLDFVFDMKSIAGFRVYVQEHIPGVPERHLPPRPPGTQPQLLPVTGETIASDILQFR
jgi:hypothetical protein